MLSMKGNKQLTMLMHMVSAKKRSIMVQAMMMLKWKLMMKGKKERNAQMRIQKRRTRT